MLITQLLRKISLELQDTSPTPGLDARLILALVTKTDPSDIYFFDRELTHSEQDKLTFYITQRQHQVPIAHLQGHKYFYGLRFQVSSHVLVPRPESEYMVDKTITISHQYPSPTIIDIGTGSGCLALSIAKYCPQATIYATDISPQALHIAKKNATIHTLKQVNFIQSDLLDHIQVRPNIIVANLPYLTEDKMTHPSLSYEPHLALYSNHNGIGHYLTLFDQIYNLHLSTHLIIEIDPQQKQSLVDELKRRFFLTYLEIAQDLAGKDRHISCYINVNYAERR